MPVLNEQKYLGDWLKWEPDNHYSRDIVTVLAGSGADR
ncbi:MAG: head decoration protein, partial [Acidobacteria bacterium]|nr:head decoration protein [Acidobacteriota bacterium]